MVALEELRKWVVRRGLRSDRQFHQTQHGALTALVRLAAHSYSDRTTADRPIGQDEGREWVGTGRSSNKGGRPVWVGSGYGVCAIGRVSQEDAPTAAVALSGKANGDAGG